MPAIRCPAASAWLVSLMNAASCTDIDACVHDPNQRNFANIRNSILQVTNGTLPANYRVPHLGSSPLPSSSPSYHGHAGMASSDPYGSGHSPAHGRPPHFAHQGLQFKPSPFYQIESALGDVRQCEGASRRFPFFFFFFCALRCAATEPRHRLTRPRAAMAQHRNSIAIVIRASQYPDLQRCLSDPTMRVLVFCAASNYDVQDVAFPYQCEIKVNGGEIKANLRGLKNKPGSTRPVDITAYLRLKPPTYGNSLEFTYALTSKVRATWSDPGPASRRRLLTSVHSDSTWPCTFARPSLRRRSRPASRAAVASQRSRSSEKVRVPRLVRPASRARGRGGACAFWPGAHRPY